MIDLRAIDFANWKNAREIARADSGDDVAIDGWVTLNIRGVEVQYHVADDFAYVETDLCPILSDFTLVEDRLEWSNK